MKNWTSLTELLLILLLAGAADGLMDALGPRGFAAVSAAVLGAAAVLDWAGDVLCLPRRPGAASEGTREGVGEHDEGDVSWRF